MIPLKLSYSTCAEKDRRAQAARLMSEAMRRDMEAQRGLIDARARGETDAVYWTRPFRDSGARELHEQTCHLRDKIQCNLIRVHLAIGKVSAEVARSRALLAARRAGER